MTKSETVTVPGPWRIMSKVRAANRKLNQKFFDEAMRAFYQTRWEKQPDKGSMIDGRFFINSDIWTLQDGRRWTVWAVCDDGYIIPVWATGHHASLDSAVSDLHELRRSAKGGLVKIDKMRGRK